VEVIDTVGAGDAFAGAFSASLAAGTEPGAAVGFALAAGALACTRSGAALAMPTRAAILALPAPVRPGDGAGDSL
jgi:ribokinase